MLASCRTEGELFTIPTFDLTPHDVDGFLDELQLFHDQFRHCFVCSEPREHFFHYMVGQFSELERKSIEPMALNVDGGNVRGMQRFISNGIWKEDIMRQTHHALDVASKDTDHHQEAEDVSVMSDRRRAVHRPYV